MKRLLLAATLACLGVEPASLSAAYAAPQITIDNGPISGMEQNGVTAYLGIPYAAPPVGDLRWMPPEPARAWTQPLEASKHGSTCPQNADFGVFAEAGGKEDCLFLNVFSKSRQDSATAKRPVLVWFHGGGYVAGTGDDYDASKLVNLGDAVVVTINYRLGVLGFFAHPSLDGGGHPFANYGLMDQQFALQWVKRNIARFGGDPENITIFGESSGGTSVLSHIVSPASAGLFQHAISMTGGSVMIKYPNFASSPPIKNAEELGANFATAAGCTDQTAKCLRALPVSKILSTQTPFMVFQAIIDGNVLPMTYKEAFISGKVNTATLIAGNTLDEWRWLAGFLENGSGKAMSDADYLTMLAGTYGKELAAKVAEKYPLSEYQTPSEAFASAVTDSLNACSNRLVNRLLSDKMPTFAYEFADRTAPSYLKPTSFPLGAAHTFELSYIFPGFHGGGGIETKLNPLQEKLSAKMIEYWTTLGNAARRESEWPRYDPKQDNFLTLILPEPRMISGRFGDYHKCKFWEETGIY